MENDTDTEVVEQSTDDSPGLMDRFDELFDDGGEPKQGTTELLDPDAPAAPEAVEEEAPAVEEEPEAKEEPEADEKPDEEAKSEDKDEFDAETDAQVAEMATDAHPGLKFAELRRELKEAKAINDQIRADALNTEEVQQYKLKADEAIKLEERVQELQGRLNTIDYESTDDYAREVKAPLSDVQNLAAAIEQNNGLEAGAVVKAVFSTDQAQQSAAIERLVDEHSLSRRDETRLFSMADQVLHLEAKRGILRDQADSKLSELQEMQVSQQTYQQAQERAAVDTSVNNVFDQYEGRFPGFVDSDGNPTSTWTEARAASQGVEITSAEDKAHAIFASNILPSVLDQVQSLSADLKEKNAVLARMTKAAPSTEPGVPASPKSTKTEGETFMDRLSSFEF